jgi:trehalose utilization protein
VWNEFIHERENAVVREVYPDGIHAAIAAALGSDDEIEVSTATLDEPEHGLPTSRLDAADVLVWWGHKAHGQVSDEVVERVVTRVHQGMGLIVLHSGHFSKVFRRLMGTPCSLRWREAGERERLWVINRSHPIVQGVGPSIELPNAEMYGEPFLVPEPIETVFVSWFEGGEVFRSGLTYQRGAGRIFYFRPGHETYPIYHNQQQHYVDQRGKVDFRIVALSRVQLHCQAPASSLRRCSASTSLIASFSMSTTSVSTRLR